MDNLLAGAAFSRPGMDTRQWISYGIVDQETPEARSIKFDESLGPLINVTLAPSRIPTVCRVASNIAGSEEGEWFPFLPGEEVLVAVPEGSERAGCVIIGRLYNEIDKWPRKVAGQDATKNTFGFKRLRTPYIIETASSFMIRSALTGANLTIDQTGNLFLVSGDGHRFVMNADAIQLGEADGDTFLQIDMDAKEILLQVNSAAQFLFSDKESQFSTPGSLQILTAGVPYAQHAITFEQVVGLLVNYTVFLKNSGLTLLAPTLLSPTAFSTAFAAMLNGMLNPTPFPEGLPMSAYSGNYASMPLLFGPAGATNTALAGQALPAVDITGFMPGIARNSFKY